MTYKIIGGIIGLVVLVAGLDAYFSSGSTHQTIAKYTGYSTICVGGVQYLQFTSGAAVHVDRDGKPVACR